MKEYHKIDGLFRREEAKPHKLIYGEYRDDTVEALKDLDWIFTEKVDGTNIRVHWDGHKVSFGGRTDKASIPTTLYDHLQETFGGSVNEQVWEETFGETEVTFYGEGFGLRIQKGGGLYRQDQGFVLFDIRIGHFWLERPNLEELAKKFDIPVVPVAYTGRLEDAIEFVRSGSNMSLISEEPREAEGLVGTPKCNVLSRNGKRIIVKIKAEDFK